MATSATRFICLLIIMGLAVPSLATDYYIGDLIGWCPAVNILQWIAGKTFVVGDVLHFVSFPPVPVYLVTAEAYASCNVTAPLLANITGNFVYTLTKPGTYYFISSSAYCIPGLKVSITVP